MGMNMRIFGSKNVTWVACDSSRWYFYYCVLPAICFL